MSGFDFFFNNGQISCLLISKKKKRKGKKRERKKTTVDMNIGTYLLSCRRKEDWYLTIY